MMSELLGRVDFFYPAIAFVKFTWYFYVSRTVFLLSNKIMIREILTLVVDNIPTQYYINFKKDRKQFSFQPTLKNKTAPAFVILVENNELTISDMVDEGIAAQAKEKVKEILANSIFDQF